MRPAWVHQRPAFTVVGTRRCVGGLVVGRQLDAGDDRLDAGGWDGSVGLGDRLPGVRVTLAEASVLQGFEPDYPWHGGTLARSRQIGNAVPPALAAALLRAVTGIPDTPDPDPDLEQPA